MANKNVDINALKESQKADLLNLRAEHKTQIQELKNTQKTELAEAKAQGMKKDELYKFKNDQWIKFSQYVQDLQYDEYLLEVKQKQELDAASGITVDEAKDADKEQGNPIAIWFKHLYRNIKVAIVEKPSIIFGLLSCIGGLVMGFEINKYITAANGFPANEGLPGIYVFILLLVGMLDAVCGVQMCGERRLKSAISSVICAVIITVFGILWIVALNSESYTSNAAATQTISFTVLYMICAIAGAVGSMFTYNKHYVKARK